MACLSAQSTYARVTLAMHLMRWDCLPLCAVAQRCGCKCSTGDVATGLVYSVGAAIHRAVTATGLHLPVQFYALAVHELWPACTWCHDSGVRVKKFLTQLACLVQAWSRHGALIYPQSSPDAARPPISMPGESITPRITVVFKAAWSSRAVFLA